MLRVGNHLHANHYRSGLIIPVIIVRALYSSSLRTDLNQFGALLEKRRFIATTDYTNVS